MGHPMSRSVPWDNKKNTPFKTLHKITTQWVRMTASPEFKSYPCLW